MDSTTEVVLANPPDARKLTQLEQATHAMQGTATALVVDDVATYEAAGKVIADCAKMAKTLEELLRPGIKAADAFHRTLTTQLNAHLAPLGNARQIVNDKMSEWRVKEHQKKLAAEAKLREQLAKDAEDRRLEQAEHLEKIGKPQEAEAVLERPTPAPVVHVESAVPKIAGQSIRKTWRARVVDASLVPDKYKVVDMTGLNAIARSLKDRAEVPGVEFFCKETIAQGSVQE